MSNEITERQFRLYGEILSEPTEISFFLNNKQLYSGLVVNNLDEDDKKYFLSGSFDYSLDIKTIQKAQITCHQGSLIFGPPAWNFGKEVNPLLTDNELFHKTTEFPIPLSVKNSVRNKGGFFYYNQNIFMTNDCGCENRSMVVLNGKLISIEDEQLIQLNQSDVIEFDVEIFAPLFFKPEL